VQAAAPAVPHWICPLICPGVIAVFVNVGRKTCTLIFDAFERRIHQSDPWYNLDQQADFLPMSN